MENWLILVCTAAIAMAIRAVGGEGGSIALGRGLPPLLYPIASGPARRSIPIWAGPPDPAFS
jgi:hypothetical protein